MNSVLVVSSSLNPESRSDRIAVLAAAQLEANGCAARLVRLKDHVLPPFGDDACFASEAYEKLYSMTDQAGSIVFASPIYNWSCCAELKKYLEAIGSISSADGARRGAFFDKLISFGLAAGLPHSYMAAGPLMLSMMLDFKCIVNPQQAYIHNRHWKDDGNFTDEGTARVAAMVDMHVELAGRLKGRTRRSTWSV